MDHLFPQFPAPMVTLWEAEEGPLPLTAAEINAAVDRVRTKKARKAPGPDGRPNSVWTIVRWANPEILDIVFNSALKSGVCLIPQKMNWLVLPQKTWLASWRPNLVSVTLHIKLYTHTGWHRSRYPNLYSKKKVPLFCITRFLWCNVSLNKPNCNVPCQVDHIGSSTTACATVYTFSLVRASLGQPVHNASPTEPKCLNFRSML